MLRLPFNGLYIVTQIFGVNPDDYAKFLVLYPDGKRYPMKGHNGIDFGTPHRTEIVAPHDGEVLEALFDAPGYGWYIKIENDIEGSVLGHLDAIDVRVGYQIKAGEHLGWSDNTGNSSGPHLHWGYYRKPRNRANGMAGFIDQAPFLANAGILLTEGKLPAFVHTQSVGTELDGRGLDLTNKASIQEAINTWYDVAHGKYRTVVEYQGLEQQLEAVKKQLEETQKQDENNIESLKKYNELKALGYNTVDDVKKALDAKDVTNTALQTENTKLLKRIDVLAGEIQSSAEEDHTTADLGQQALTENKELKETVTEIAKVADAEKPTLNNIVEKIFGFRELADRFMKKMDAEQEAREGEPVKSENVKRISTGAKLLLQLFRIIPQRKGGDIT